MRLRVSAGGLHIVPIDSHRAARQVWVRAGIESECRCREGTGEQNYREQFTDGSHQVVDEAGGRCRDRTYDLSRVKRTLSR